MKIREFCSPLPTDDPKIKNIKSAVLAKLDHRFPETDSVKLHRLLDPETKGFMQREEATRILEAAINTACEKNYINSSHASGVHSMGAAAGGFDGEDQGDPDIKRKHLRREMVNELRIDTPHSDESQVYFAPTIPRSHDGHMARHQLSDLLYLYFYNNSTDYYRSMHSIDFLRKCHFFNFANFKLFFL